MRMKKILLFVVLMALVFSIALSQDEHEGMTDPDTALFDPFEEDAGDFLDVDITKYKTRAFELYSEQKYTQAAKYYLAALSYDIHDNISLYNLACCYGLLDKPELAARFLIRSVRAGYEDIEHMKGDPDFDKVRGKAVFDAALDSITTVIAERKKDMGNAIYHDATVLLECRIHLPEDYDPGNRYILIVGLHGYGSNPDRFITLWKRFGDDRFIYASPQAPYPFPVGTDVGYSWGLRTQNAALWNSAADMSEKYICNAVKSICMNYNIDKVYLMGFSQGCAFTYRTGIKNHHLFRGLICFGGWLNEDWISEYSIREARELRVFIGHGKNDNSVEFEGGEKAFDVLKDSHYDVTFEPFDGGHAVPEEIMKKAIGWIEKDANEP